MSIRRIQPGPSFTEAVVFQRVVYLSGQVALGAEGESLGAQTSDVLARIDSLLAEAGSDRSRILSAQVLLTDIRRIEEFNEVWVEWLSGVAPSRTTAEARLGSLGWDVEVTVVAATA